METKVNIDIVKTGLLNYIDNEIINKLPTSKKFLASVALGLGYENVVNTYLQHPMVKTLGIIDDNNMVDVGRIYDVSKTEISKLGKIEMFGIIFNEADIDKIYDEITKL